MGIKIEIPSRKFRSKSTLPWMQSVKSIPSLTASLPHWITASKRCQRQLQRHWQTLLIALEDPEER